MEFKNLQDLVNRINAELEDFCDDFQYKRRELLGLKQTKPQHRLFGNARIKGNYDRAINIGGGTELQYYIAQAIDRGGYILYGLGFSARFTAFHYAKSPIGYIRPFVDSFLAQPTLKEQLADEGFNISAAQALESIHHGQYYLFPKSIKVLRDNRHYAMLDDDFVTMFHDLQGVMYDVYVAVLSTIHH